MYSRSRNQPIRVISILPDLVLRCRYMLFVVYDRKSFVEILSALERKTCCLGICLHKYKHCEEV